VWVFEAITGIEKRLPFRVLGIDSDNDSAFINNHLLRYCNENQITFTRTRAHRKNDNCFVEQKNYSVVRKAVGYLRYDTEEELKIINELYGHLRLYTNFFQPVMKLIEKIRIGSKVIKKYDKPRTPYQRVLESSHVSEGNKEQLRRQYATLNPAELKRQITRLQNKLLKIASLKANLRRQGESKMAQSRGYLCMDRASKIDYRANDEAGFSGLTPESVLSDNIDLKQDKKTELV